MSIILIENTSEKRTTTFKKFVKKSTAYLVRKFEKKILGCKLSFVPKNITDHGILSGTRND
jgi:hypothetical protein